MKKSEPTPILYPFDSYHLPYRCDKCGKMLRYSAVHNRIYVISEFQALEVPEIRSKNHTCFKDLSKGGKKH